MVNRRRDVPFCGVDLEAIQSKSPIFDKEALKLLHHYITERYKIHILKDILKKNRPWTDDFYLHTYKFTNIRREHDRASKWLIENISNSLNSTTLERMYRTILFRIYNRPITGEILGLSDLKFDGDWVERCKAALSNRDSNVKLFTNAYKTGGTKTGLLSFCPEAENTDYAPLYAIQKLREENLAEDLLECDSQDKVFKRLTEIKGFGKFIAYQVYVDLTYIKEFPFSENEFTVAGPGCYYGIQLLTGKDKEDTGFNGLTSEEILFWMRDNLVSKFTEEGLEFNPDKIFHDLPEEDRKFNVMSLENVMCEFSKYYTLHHGIRKARMKYNPHR